MVKAISDALRVQVLWESGIKKPTNIAKRTRIPLRTCYRYASRLLNGENLERKSYSKRDKKIVPKVVRKVIAKAKNQKRPFSCRDLAASVNISHSSIRRILISRGFLFKKSHKKVFLKPEDMQRRLAFANQMKSRESDWGYVIFTDESSFWLNKSKPRCRWVEGGNGIEGYKAHGPKVHVWGAISLRGTVSLEIFEDNMDAALYRNILQKKKRFMEGLYPEGFILQLDNDPKHKAHETQNFIENNFEMALQWPPYSPDLSPIENIWSWLKAQVRKDLPQTVKSLKTSILKNWKKIDQNFLLPYIESMIKRIDLCISVNGNLTKY